MEAIHLGLIRVLKSSKKVKKTTLPQQNSHRGKIGR